MYGYGVGFGTRFDQIGVKLKCMNFYCLTCQSTLDLMVLISDVIDQIVMIRLFVAVQSIIVGLSGDTNAYDGIIHTIKL
jgi:hypothetical protein